MLENYTRITRIKQRITDNNFDKVIYMKQKQELF